MSRNPSRAEISPIIPFEESIRGRNSLPDLNKEHPSPINFKIATGYRLEDRGVGIRVPVRSRIFTSHVVQTGSLVHSTSYTMGTAGSFPGVKRPGREADHSPPTSTEVKTMWIYTSTSPYAFMTQCLVKHRDNFTLPLPIKHTDCILSVKRFQWNLTLEFIKIQT
jgi:hypothetical protein